MGSPRLAAPVSTQARLNKLVGCSCLTHATARQALKPATCQSDWAVTTKGPVVLPIVASELEACLPWLGACSQAEWADGAETAQPRTCNAAQAAVRLYAAGSSAKVLRMPVLCPYLHVRPMAGRAGLPALTGQVGLAEAADASDGMCGQLCHAPSRLQLVGRPRCMAATLVGECRSAGAHQRMALAQALATSACSGRPPHSIQHVLESGLHTHIPKAGTLGNTWCHATRLPDHLPPSGSHAAEQHAQLRRPRGTATKRCRAGPSEGKR